MTTFRTKKTPATVTPAFLKQELNRFFSQTATKKDLESFATKKDLESFATKKDLESFATKKDLESFATKKDLESFATKKELAEAITPLATKQELAEVIEDLRDEIITGQDKIMTILMRLDTDRLSLTHGHRRLQTTVDNHETRLRSLERGRSAA